MIILFIPTFVGLLFIQSKIKLKLGEYIYYYSLLNILSNTATYIVGYTDKYLFFFISILFNLLFSCIIVLLNKDIKITIGGK